MGAAHVQHRLGRWYLVTLAAVAALLVAGLAMPVLGRGAQSGADDRKDPADRPRIGEITDQQLHFSRRSARKLRDILFQPYVTLKAEGIGLGLGLALAQDIRRQRGGDLFREDMPTGARFIMGMPAA